MSKATPAAIAVLRQATALRPTRKKISDGLLPSAAHRKASPDSDHNKGLAVDLTHDPKNGIDCEKIFEKLKEDKRVKYLIFAGQIWSKEKAKLGNRRYIGSNSHHKHLHISIEPALGTDTSPWFWWHHRDNRKDRIMEFKDYLTVAVACIAIFSAIAGGIRWLVKHYLNELKPNGGTSMKDSMARMEARIDDLYKLVAEK